MIICGKYVSPLWYNPRWWYGHLRSWVRGLRKVHRHQWAMESKVKKLQGRVLAIERGYGNHDELREELGEFCSEFMELLRRVNWLEIRLQKLELPPETE